MRKKSLGGIGATRIIRNERGNRRTPGLRNCDACEVKRDDCPGLPGIVCVATEDLSQRRNASDCSVGWLRQIGWRDSELYHSTTQQLTSLGRNGGH